ncbi:hypothetical protein DLAC_11250 [Tieghemostelium lacteum]|uniref:Uncharacterized protein n=1 Tax=Tieghemostelium lacteum TaxID=361077 RepID=A0A151Z3J0_TIELA|nr:hypothetical protein DLAC_11250 [Tieghemostelium lacteum]|eukprot:KYQ88526.1 hypothetical protein DLAC_11250 [Tieghemostelium lacteum]
MKGFEIESVEQLMCLSKWLKRGLKFINFRFYPPLFLVDFDGTLDTVLDTLVYALEDQKRVNELQVKIKEFLTGNPNKYIKYLKFTVENAWLPDGHLTITRKYNQQIPISYVEDLVPFTDKLNGQVHLLNLHLSDHKTYNFELGQVVKILNRYNVVECNLNMEGNDSVLLNELEPFTQCHHLKKLCMSISNIHVDTLLENNPQLETLVILEESEYTASRSLFSLTLTNHKSLKHLTNHNFNDEFYKDFIYYLSNNNVIESLNLQTRFIELNEYDSKEPTISNQSLKSIIVHQNHCSAKFLDFWKIPSALEQVNGVWTFNNLTRSKEYQKLHPNLKTMSIHASLQTHFIQLSKFISIQHIPQVTNLGILCLNSDYLRFIPSLYTFYSLTHLTLGYTAEEDIEQFIRTYKNHLTYFEFSCQLIQPIVDVLLDNPLCQSLKIKDNSNIGSLSPYYKLLEYNIVIKEIDFEYESYNRLSVPEKLEFQYYIKKYYKTKPSNQIFPPLSPNSISSHYWKAICELSKNS